MSGSYGLSLLHSGKNEKQAVKIRWQDGGSNVQVVGSFSDWQNPVQLTLTRQVLED
jgi:hypothetical protein